MDDDPGDDGGGNRRRRRAAGGAAAHAVVTARWAVLAAWAVAAVVLVLAVPNHPRPGGGGVEDLLPPDSPALLGQVDELEHFAFPLLARQVVVQRDPARLSVSAQLRTLARAVEIDAGGRPGTDIAGALPVTNVGGLVPGSREAGTATATFLFFRPDVDAFTRLRDSQAFADSLARPPGTYVGVSGPVAARLAQGDLLAGRLPLIEALTLVLVVVVCALMFRSALLPVLVLATAALAFVIAARVLALAAVLFGAGVPPELEPIAVALVVGVATDYLIFFAVATRRRQREGADAVGAAAGGGAEVAPVVLIAGLTTAGALAGLALAGLGLYARLGPALGGFVLVAVAVSVTFVPAVLAVAGPAAFWPGGATGRNNGTPPDDAWLATGHRPRTVLAVTAMVTAVAVAALATGRPALGANLIAGLPDGSPPARAAAEAAAGFSPGIIAPTELLVVGQGFAGRREALAAVQRHIAAAEGVAGVLGPAQNPMAEGRGLFVARSGQAARFLVILADEPYSGAAIATVDRLSRAMPGWLDETGVPGRATTLGDTAIARELVDATRLDLARVGAAIALLELALLLLFLRSAAAALVLLALGAAVVIVALVVTGTVLAPLWGTDSLTFYVPVAVSALLLGFVTDYNVLLVQRAAQLRGRAGPGDFILRAARDVRPAVTDAGLALAASFAALAVVPIAAVRQTAAALIVGVAIELAVIQPLVIPACFRVFGPLMLPRPGRTAPGPANDRPADRPVI